MAVESTISALDVTLVSRQHSPEAEPRSPRSGTGRLSYPTAQKMDCKSFDARHAAYLDDTLPGFQMEAMRDHLTECTRCSRRDADVRRALLLLKNLPPIRVSDGFEDRLRARISAEGPAFQPQRARNFGMMKWGAAAALLVTIIGVSSWPGNRNQPSRPTRLPAVFAMPLSISVTDDVTAPEYVASMSTGIPMWPALMLAEEGPLRFASAGRHNASWDSSRHD